jgi:predicted nucleic acid-binding protein
MNTYVDANALVRYFLMTDGREKIIADLCSLQAPDTFPVPVTQLLKCEVTNAIERMVFESRNGGTPRISPEMAMVAHECFRSDLAEGLSFQLIPLTLSDIEREFDSLFRRHTATHGFRTYDIIHVASALKLKCRRFLSFDAKTNSLARLAGLKTL